MTAPLARELDALPPSERERLEAHGFDRNRLLELSKRLADTASFDNRVTGSVEPPREGDVVELPHRESREGRELVRAGEELIRAGKSALVVLAGGMATRMGSVVKALVEALPGRSFLDLRLAERRSLAEGAHGVVPLWLMTSAATDSAIRGALGDRLDGRQVAVFPQDVSLRLTPEGRLFKDDEGKTSEYAQGHGDLPEALRRSGLLDEFIARGGQYVTIANLDNLGATLDPLVVGFHAAHPRAVTCEVVDKLASDRGGIPARHNGRAVILEEFRIPETFDPATVRVFNTNTFHVDAKDLRDLDIDWTFFVVQKKVHGKTAIQFERLINEMTNHLDTMYLKVPRSGDASRFLPVKDPNELAQRRSEIESVARTRGMLE